MIRFFPIINIILAIGASVVYFWKDDVRHGLYWASAAVLTFSVTF